VPIRAVTLDAAGTLFTVAEPVGATYARIAADHGIAIAADAVERGFRAAFAAAPPLAFPGASPTRLAEHERAWWYTVVRAAFGAAARATAFETCFDAIFAHYARAGAWRVFPDAPAALVALRARGLRTAIVSNFDGRLRGLVDDLGLAPLVDVTLWSTRVGHAKPAPEIFVAAANALGVAPGVALHAGDGPVADVEGARRAGMTAVLVDRRATAPAAAGVRVVASLAELPPLLDALAQP